MQIKYDVTGVETGGVLIPVGVYKCKLVKAELTEPEGKDKRIEAQYEIVDGKFKGRVLYDYIQVEREDLKWKLASFTRALGLPDKGGLDLKKILGKGLNVRVKHREWNGEMQPNVAGLLPLGDDASTDSSEDLDDETTAEEEGDVYTLEELNDLDNADLKELAEEYEIETPGRMTGAAKKRLAQAIFDAQEGNDEDEEDEDEDDEDTVDLDSMSRAELRAYAKENDLEVRFLKSKSDDVIREEIAALVNDEDEEDEDDEDEVDTDDGPDDEVVYADLSIDELRAEAKERQLPTKGSKALLIKRLEKDDESESPF